VYGKKNSNLALYPSGKEEESYVVPSEISSINAIAFSGCPNLKTVEIPDTVTAIGK
jgi:hypothetical protein